MAQKVESQAEAIDDTTVEEQPSDASSPSCRTSLTPQKSLQLAAFFKEGQGFHHHGLLGAEKERLGIHSSTVSSCGAFGRLRPSQHAAREEEESRQNLQQHRIMNPKPA